MLLDNTGQQGGLSVLWTQPGTTDISQAVVDAYNASSGVGAPAGPSAPSATRPRPAPTTPPQTAAPKQQNCINRLSLSTAMSSAGLDARGIAEALLAQHNPVARSS